VAKVFCVVVADMLGFDRYAPPYLSPQASGENLLVGANFASAASSYLDDTAAMYVSMRPLSYVRAGSVIHYTQQITRGMSDDNP
jgi:hypothetical protein